MRREKFGGVSSRVKTYHRDGNNTRAPVGSWVTLGISATLTVNGGVDAAEEFADGRQRCRNAPGRTRIRACQAAPHSAGRRCAIAGRAAIVDADIQRERTARSPDLDGGRQDHSRDSRSKPAARAASERSVAGTGGRKIPGAMERFVDRRR